MTDPWGGEALTGYQGQTFTYNSFRQPKKFNSYIRDGNGGDDAQHRRYQAAWSRFDQPDPYDGSYDLGDPQSLNRYAYVGNDPVNRTDSTGLDWDDDAFEELDADFAGIPGNRGSAGGGGGGGGYGSSFGIYANSLASSPEEALYEQRLYNAWGGYGFVTNAQRDERISAQATLCLWGAGCWNAGSEVWINGRAISQFGVPGSRDTRSQEFVNAVANRTAALEPIGELYTNLMPTGGPAAGIGKGIIVGTVKNAARTGLKGLIKNAGLPTRGMVRFVPPANSINTGLRQAPGGGFIDRFGNVWRRPRGQIVGEPHWDVQLSPTGRSHFGWASRSGNHINVSIDGRIVH